MSNVSTENEGLNTPVKSWRDADGAGTNISPRRFVTTVLDLDLEDRDSDLTNLLRDFMGATFMSLISLQQHSSDLI